MSTFGQLKPYDGSTFDLFLEKTKNPFKWNYVTFIAIVAFAIIVALAFFRYKIPIVCYGCESPEGAAAWFFACINDTSPESRSCTISAGYDMLLDEGKELLDDIGSFAKVVFSELSNIPKAIRETFIYIYEQAKMLVGDVVSNLTNLAKEFGTWVAATYEGVKDAVIATYQDFKQQIIDPAINWIVQYIINPVTNFITLLVQFKNDIVSAVVAAGQGAANIALNIKSGIITALTEIPSLVLNVVNEVIKLINNVTTGTVGAVEDIINKDVIFLLNGSIDLLNSGLKEVTQVTQNVINDGIISPINAVVDFVDDGLNAVVGGVNQTSTYIADGIENTVNYGLINPANSVFDTTESVVNNGVIGPVNGVIDVLNKVSDLVTTYDVPKLANVDIPNMSQINIDPPLINANFKFDPVQDVDFVSNTPVMNKIDPISLDASGLQIPTLDVNALEEQIASGVTGTFNAISSSVQGVLDQLFAPINWVIQQASAIYAALVTAIKTVFSNIFSAQFYIDLFNQFKAGVKIIVSEAIELVKVNVVTPLWNGLLVVKDAIQAGFGQLVEFVKGVFYSIKDMLESAFTSIGTAILQFAKIVVETGSYVVFFTFAKFVDNLFPFNMSITKKINIFFFIVFFILYALLIVPLLNNLKSPLFIYGAVFAAIVLAAAIIPSFFAPSPKSLAPPTQQEIMDVFNPPGGQKKKYESDAKDLHRRGMSINGYKFSSSCSNAPRISGRVH